MASYIGERRYYDYISPIPMETVRIGMAYKQGQYDKAKNDFQEEVNKTQLIDLDRPEAKEYLYNKAKDLVSFMNKNVGVDLTNSDIKNAYRQQVSSIFDDTILNEHEATLVKRNLESEARINQKQGTYSDENYAYSVKDISRHLSEAPLGSKYEGNKKFVPYEDLMQGVKKTVKDIDPEITVSIREGQLYYEKDKKEIKNISRIAPAIDNYLKTAPALSQMQVNAYSLMGEQNPDDLIIKASNNVNSIVGLANENQKYADASAKLYGINDVEASKHQQDADYYKKMALERSNELEDILSSYKKITDPTIKKKYGERLATYVYRNNFLDNSVLSNSFYKTTEKDLKERYDVKEGIESQYRMKEDDNKTKNDMELEAYKTKLKGNETLAELELKRAEAMDKGDMNTVSALTKMINSSSGSAQSESGDEFVPQALTREGITDDKDFKTEVNKLNESIYNATTNVIESLRAADGGALIADKLEKTKTKEEQIKVLDEFLTNNEQALNGKVNKGSQYKINNYLGSTISSLKKKIELQLQVDNEAKKQINEKYPVYKNEEEYNKAIKTSFKLQETPNYVYAKVGSQEPMTFEEYKTYKNKEYSNLRTDLYIKRALYSTMPGKKVNPNDINDIVAVKSAIDASATLKSRLKEGVYGVAINFDMTDEEKKDENKYNKRLNYDLQNLIKANPKLAFAKDNKGTLYLTNETDKYEFQNSRISDKLDTYTEEAKMTAGYMVDLNSDMYNPRYREEAIKNGKAIVSQPILIRNDTNTNKDDVQARLVMRHNNTRKIEKFKYEIEFLTFDEKSGTFAIPVQSNDLYQRYLGNIANSTSGDWITLDEMKKSESNSMLRTYTNFKGLLKYTNQ